MKPAVIARRLERLDGIRKQIIDAQDMRTAEAAATEARVLVEVMVEMGYDPIAAEAQQARTRRRLGNARRRLRSAQGRASPPKATNRYGLDAHYFRVKMERMLRTLGDYTPDEFARECARMAVTAAPSVFVEQEFQDHFSEGASPCPAHKTH